MLKIKDKKMFNEHKRCLHCSGILIATTGFPPSVLLLMQNDIMKIRIHDYNKNGEDVFYDIKDIEINFCPFCGCQLRRKVDWNLCD